ncbi:MAG TPA: M23 family metallopeptidase, partial [Dyella sp.]|uniref:M23 family metallopeptidase n=1 Tax=Dyella sp. TaxID=1869338 RepID=UPI002CB4E963
MLISYPFLTPSSSDDYVQAPNDLSHLGELTGAGIFPLTQGIEWHGGSHWRGPALAGQVQPVRAIADGEVVFARASDGKPTNNDALKQHPLWYSTGWTSNGVVILKHTTEIGENVGVTFYSIYQHMDTLQDVGAAGHQHALTQGDKVYRKDVIGTAGFIYGQPHHIHIEIVADRANTALLMGRDHDELRSPQGRTSCVWGDTHIVVPADVPIYEADPTAATVAFRIPTLHVTAASVEALFHTPIARLRALTKPVSGLDDPSDSDAKWFSKRNGDYQHAQHPGSEPTDEQRTIQVPLLYGAAVDTAPNSPQRTQLPARYFAKEVGRTPHDILVTLSEAHGKLTVTTRLELGGTPETVQEKGAYDLYERSLKASPGCPSAGYEMLRFGRILGPDQAAASDLHMGRLPHFRPIAFTSAQGQRVEGFIDLNAEDVNVFSDADFPHWDGWTFIADDVAVDSRARSTMLLDLIDPPSTTPAAPSATLPTPEQVRQQKQARLVRIQAALANVDTQKKLRKCVVTMAT